MSANYGKYHDAMNRAQELTTRYDALDERLNNEMEAYKQKAGNNTGEKGILNAYDTGSKLAQKTAGDIATTAQGSARQTGMSKAASAMMGANKAGESYAQTLGNAANSAYNAQQDELNAQKTNINNAQQNISNIGERVSQQTGMAGQQADLSTKRNEQVYQGVGTGLQAAGTVASFMSDERLKHIFGEKDCHKVTDLLSKINAIEFQYTDEAQDKYDGEKNVDSDTHVGVSAQELEENPLTRSVVEINENGDREVNASELTAINTASLSSLAKELQELKDMVWQLQHKEDDAHNRPRKEYVEESHDKMIDNIATVMKRTGFDFTHKGE